MDNQDTDLFVGLLSQGGGGGLWRDFQWKAENRLVAIAPHSPQENDRKFTYTYDYQGRRIRKQIFKWTSGAWVVQPNETGLGYWGYRYYSPTLGRWMSRDPIEEDGGFNLYAYAVNRPTTAVDLLGLNLYAVDGTFGDWGEQNMKCVPLCVTHFKLYNTARSR